MMPSGRIVSGMATKKLPTKPRRETEIDGQVVEIHKGAGGHLYLREHRKAHHVSAPRMAERLGITRGSLLRLEKEARTRCSPEKQAAFAAALEIEPEALWRPPGAITIIADAPPDVKAMAADIVRRLMAKSA